MKFTTRQSLTFLSDQTMKSFMHIDLFDRIFLYIFLKKSGNKNKRPAKRPCYIYNDLFTTHWS